MSSPRGQFSLTWRSDILCLTLIGNCGLPMILQAHQAVRHAWQERAGRPWGGLTDLTLFEGISPEALQAIWDMVKEAIEHGMVAASDLQAPGHFRVTPTTTRQEVGSRIPLRTSASADDAMAWFAELGLRSD